MCKTVCLQVEDWEGRSRIENGVCVAVKEHKVPLSHEQELVSLYSLLYNNSNKCIVSNLDLFFSVL